MATHIHTHADGKQYRREFVTGRRALPAEIKCRRRTITLSPKLDDAARKWKQRTGQDFSAWVADKMREVVLVNTETV